MFQLSSIGAALVYGFAFSNTISTMRNIVAPTHPVTIAPSCGADTGKETSAQTAGSRHTVRHTTTPPPAATAAAPAMSCRDELATGFVTE